MVHVLNSRGREFGDRPALFRKTSTGWVPTSWRQYAERAERFARGLVALGFQPKQAVGVLSFNREEWHLADYGTMAAGGVPAGIYTTCSAEQVQYILQHCEAPVVVVENLDQLAKVRSQKTSLPNLRWAVLIDGTVPSSDESWVITFDQLLQKGDAIAPEVVHERIDKLEPNGLATLIYTSGTTGPPKAVMLSHQNLVWTVDHLGRSVGDPKDELLISYLPLSHIAEQMVSMHGGVWNHFQIYFAQSLEKLPEHLREVRPTLFFAVPRVWEKFKSKLEDGIASQPRARQELLRQASRLTRARHALHQEGRKVNPLLEAAYFAAQRLTFHQLKARLGLDRCRLFATSAAPIGRDVLDFFCGLDMVLLESYGQSEVTGPSTVNSPDRARLGTLGQPMMGVTVKIAEDGEILVKGGNVCLGYYKDPESTAELLDKDGWLHSGDVGEFDADGFLRITDRKKDLIVTSGGKKAAPQNLEKMLRAIPPVGQAVVVGERRNYLCALLTLDRDAAKRFARENNLPEDFDALIKHPRLQAALQKGVDEMNSHLARFETIKRFVVLPGEFSAESGELTPTLKIKRKVVAQKYGPQIESMYPGEEAQSNAG
jgi:long-chain acyl-CoA synthetase